MERRNRLLYLREMRNERLFKAIGRNDREKLNIIYT